MSDCDKCQVNIKKMRNAGTCSMCMDDWMESEKIKEDAMKEIMMARPKYDRKSKKYNVAVNCHGEEILIGKAEGIFVRYSEFDTKQSTIDYINSKEKLTLAKNLLEMVKGK